MTTKIQKGAKAPMVACLMSLLVVFALSCAQQDSTSGTGPGGSGNSGSGGSGNSGSGGSGNSGSGGSGAPGVGGAPGTGSGGRGGSGGSTMVLRGSGGVQGQGGAGGSISGGSGSGGSPAGGANGSAGATGTAGATGAAGGNGSGGTTASSSGCAGKTYKLCEDFESDTVGSLPAGWTKFQGYAQDSPQDQAVATDEFHSGSKSLKSISAAQGGNRIQKSLAALGATANKHWGRIFYKVQYPSAVDNSHVLHTTFVSLTGGSTEDRIVDTVETQGAHTHQWLMNTPDDECCTKSDYNWTFDDGWHCAEWYVDLTTKSFRFFSDSSEVTKIAFANRGGAEMPASYMAIVLGATYYQTDQLSGPFVMWIDDLAIDDTQIHCQ